MNVLAWILSGLLAFAFIGAGLPKVVSARESILKDPRMGWANDFTGVQIKAIGGLEVLGGVGIILPWLLGVARILTPLAGVGLAVIMIGALVATGRRGEASKAWPVNFALLGLAIAVAAVRFTQI